MYDVLTSKKTNKNVLPVIYGVKPIDFEEKRMTTIFFLHLSTGLDMLRSPKACYRKQIVYDTRSAVDTISYIV